MKLRKFPLHQWLLPSVMLVSANAHATDGTWTQLSAGSATGNWSLNTNWSGSNVASGSGATANFNTLDVTALSTITLNSPFTVGNLIFGDTDTTTAASWVVSGANTLTLAGGTPTVTVNALGTGASATISSAIDGTSGLTKEGSGKLILSGVNTYSGGTFINNGNITATTGVSAGSGNATAFGTGDITVNSGGTITGGAARSIGGGSATTRAVNLIGSTLDVTYAGGGGEYFSKLNLTGGSITATAAEFFRAASSGLTISSLASASSSTVSSNIDLTSGSLVVNVADGAAADDLVISGRINQTGTRSLTKNGSGTLVLTSSLTGGGTLYSGGTIISNGTIIGKTNDFAFGNTTSTITLGDVNTGSSDVALLLGDTRSIANNIIVSASGSGSVTIGTANFTPGAVNTNFGGTLALNRDVTLQAGSTDRTTFSNQITGTGNITITSPFANNRVVVFDRTSGTANSFVGDITIANNARLQIGVANSIGNRTITDTSAIRFENANSAFRIAPAGSGDSETVGSLVSNNSGAGVVDMITGSSFTLAIGGDNNANADFSGVITDSFGTLAITKVGTGTQILSGAGTYSGATTVSAGCLSLGNIGAIPSVSQVTVASGAGFGGIVGPSNLSDANIQNIVNNTVWSGSGSYLVIDTNGANITVAANITGNIGLIKKGNGILTLTGTNTYTGPTIVQGGSIAGFATAITGVTIVKSGSNATLTFTASGNVDVYRSTDLVTWGAPYATNKTSPYTDTAATAPKLFYVLVPAGQPYP